jgi:Rrf2 family iron-sulfur cluster assembly transcriptional regulator
MQLTRAADYGVRVMVHLASLSPGTRLNLAELADASDVSPSFLSKVLQQLVKAKFVTSSRGKGGGFALVFRETPPSLLDIITALDGLPPLNDCLKADDGCERRTWCGAHLVWIEAQRQLHAVLASASLDSLVTMTAVRRAATGM